jgi:phosphonate transport system permease protein
VRLEELESARPSLVLRRPARVARRPAWWRDARAGWGLSAGALLAWAAWRSGLAAGEAVNPGGAALLARLARAAFRPALDPEFLRLAWDATWTTLAFAACGTAVSLLLGAAGGVLASEAWWELVRPPGRRGRWRLLGVRAPWLAVRGALAVPRAIHEIVWGILLVSVLGLDPVVAVLAIGIPFGAITAKVFSELLDETPRDALAALRTAGARPLSAFLYGLLPPALPDLVSYAFYRFECAIRSAAVLGIVGVGGLGYEILLSLRSLRYEQVWTLVFALMALAGAADLWSSVVRRRLGTGARTEGLDARRPGAAGRWRTDPVPRVSLGAIALLLAFGFVVVDANFGLLADSRTWTLAADLATRAWPPAAGPLDAADWIAITADTLAMSVLAIAVAGALGTLLSFPAARTIAWPGGLLNRDGPGAWPGAVAHLLARGLLLLLRAVPAPIWALAFLFVLFPGILPGALALAAYTGGVLGRLMAEVVENLDPRPLAALRAQGASRAQIFLYGVLPAALPRYVAYLLYRWEVCIRATAMVGVVGAGGLGRLLTEALSSFDYPVVTTVLLAYLALAWTVDVLSAAVRRDLR